MHLRIAALLLLVFPLPLLAAGRSSRGKAAETPDFLQTDRDAGFANAGTQYCAPTAVSNSLMWLAANGYDELRPAGNEKRAQTKMIRTLAGADYMNTSPTTGTDSAQVLHGVEQYVTEAGYTIEELSYEGWRRVPSDYQAGEFPDLDDIRNAIADERSAVWLNVGWYRYDEESGDYLRLGGHWVTVVGHRGDDLLIHDPAPGAGRSFRTQRISLEEIEEGQLTGKQANLPHDAAGYYEVGGEMAIRAGWTCILDGVVFLRLE